MTTNQFGIKHVECDTNKIHATIQEVEEQWLDALLLRMSIPKIILRKKRAGETHNQQWRDYLFNTFGLNIYKNLSTGLVQVYKYNTQREENTLVAEWSAPEVVYKKEGSSKRCELRLKYWQIV